MRQLHARSDMTFAFVTTHRRIWPLIWMCDVLGVSRSGYHACCKRPINVRMSQDTKLFVETDKRFKASVGPYGARRVWRDVLEDGLRHAPTCRIISSGATIQDDAAGVCHKLGYLTPWSSRPALCWLNPLSTKPAAG